MENIKLTDIIVGERLRKDYGDMSDLDSIEDVGLIQPLVFNKTDDGRVSLLAGGRRLQKLKDLGITEVVHGITSTPGQAGFVYAEELQPDVRREIELYENIGRKQMDWKERVQGIAEIHQLKMKRAALDREPWGLRETGAELGIHFGTAAWMVMIAEELKKPDSAIHDCKGSTEAIKWLLERKEDEAKRQLAKMTVATLPSSALAPVVESNKTLEEGPPLTVPLSNMLFHRDLMDTYIKQVDHIVTDWPYAIDMDYLDQGQGMDVSRVRAEHDVKDNLSKYNLWLGKMFGLLKEGGFCVIWYDNVNWQLIRDTAESRGFRVQRWPLVWVKTSPCLNQMANKNWTKATEFAIVLSKGNSFLVKPQSTNYWSGPRAASTSNPFAKPKALWQWIYSAISVQGQTILDPFAGEGSATLAAIDFGLRPIAIESNENHFNQLTLNVRELYSSLTKGNVKFE